MQKKYWIPVLAALARNDAVCIFMDKRDIFLLVLAMALIGAMAITFSCGGGKSRHGVGVRDLGVLHYPKIAQNF